MTAGRKSRLLKSELLYNLAAIFRAKDFSDFFGGFFTAIVEPHAENAIQSLPEEFHVVIDIFVVI